MSFVSAYRHNMNLIQGEGGKSCQWHDFEIIPISLAKSSALQSHLMPAGA